MTWGAAQHHFGAKEDILQAILDRSHQRFSERVADPSLLKGPLNTRVDLFVDLMWKHYQDDLYRVTLEILLAMRAFQPTTPSKAEEPHNCAHQKTMRSIFHDSKINQATLPAAMPFAHRFDEPRVGKDCVSTCRSRW